MARGRAADPLEVKAFVVEAIEAGHEKLVSRVSRRFGVTRQTANAYVAELLRNGVITRVRPGLFQIAEQRSEFFYTVDGLEEHRVWADDIAPLVADLPNNVVEILDYGCTEMVNNVIDHSESESVAVELTRTPVETRLVVFDTGVGIFRKIADSLGLEDDRHAVLELSKGKVTTDPENHSGEGVFFSSRAFDSFAILSGSVWFSHQHDEVEDWISGDEHISKRPKGTAVFMTMGNESVTNLTGVFDEYSDGTEEYRFDRTVVPVKLASYGDDRLVSRSQAKRLLNRVDRFSTVILDFAGVPSIGQAFADEVFRVFTSKHPGIDVVAINQNEQVSRMIARASAQS